MAIRVLVCTADEELGDALAALVREREDFEVVARADTGREAVALANAFGPDVVLLDTSLEDSAAGEICLCIRTDVPKSRVVALSLHTDPRFVSGMLRVGAVGYVVTSSVYEELPRAMDAVCSGEPYLCRAVLDVAVERGLRVDR